METHTECVVDTGAWFSSYVSMPTPSPTTTLLSVVYDLTKALLEPRESSSSPSFIVNHTRVLLELANIFKQSLLLPTIERRDDIIEDDDDNREISTENEVFRTTGPILRYNKDDNISTIQHLHDDDTVRMSNISDPIRSDTTERSSTNINITNINDSLPRVREETREKIVF